MAFEMSWEGEGEAIVRLGEKLFEAVSCQATARHQPYSSLSESKQREYAAMAYELLRHAPYGLPSERIREWLDLGYEHSFSPGEMREMQDALVNRLFPDVGAFLRGEIPSCTDDCSPAPSETPRTRRMQAKWGPALTLSGRLTRRTWSAQVVKEQFMMSVDEVMKSVLFCLTSKGYRVAAANGHSIVLHLPAQPCPEDQVSIVKQFVRDALTYLLGSRLFPRCRYELTDEW